MKKIAVLAMAALLAAGMLTGCRKDKNDSSTEMITFSSQNVAEIQVSVAMNEEADENETVFKLNSVIDSGVRTEDSGKTMKYIYLNATIKNTSDTDYSLSYLNNFEMILPDGTSILPHMRTDSYGKAHYSNYAPTPFTVPAKGEFTGYITGFEVEESVDSFTVCFYPTQNDNNKRTVVKVEVAPGDIKQLPEDK